MEQVGGDFYDFIPFRDQNKIGIFLSDVSGHGVPAAFITAMLKSAILQADYDCKKNPALFMHYLNEHLLDQTGDNFVTAFYGIYDPATRKFVYSNAGHNSPFLVDDGALSMFLSRKGLPLAVSNNMELAELDKNYTNNVIILPENSKLLLYTDGLVEAIAPDDPDTYFEDELLPICLLNNASQPCREYVNTIFRELVAFRGSEDFEDDFCMICLDV